MKKWMLVAALSAGLNAFGANWTNYGGGAPLLEDPDNWNAAMGETVAATFAPPSGTIQTVTTVAGFSNGTFTATVPSSALTFDIPTGQTYSVLDFNLSSSPHGVVIVQGGGTFAIRNVTRFGNSGIFNTLVITNGASFLAHGGDFNIALGSNLASNLFLVSNARCAHTSGTFYVGRNGRDNKVIINDNAVFIGVGTTLGQADSASNNLVRIDSATLTNGSSRVGQYGSNNRIEVTNGGEWYMNGGTVYMGENPGANQNVVEVTDGGTCNVADLRIGCNMNSQANAVIVKGTDASITVRATRTAVGYNGHSNSLKISEGASFSTPVLNIGHDAGASNNIMQVESGGTLTVGTTLTVGNNATASNNTMRVENATVDIGGALTVNHAGTLTLAGTNPVVRVKAASNNGMTVSNGSALRFEFGAAAPQSPLIDVTTRPLSVTDPGPLTIDAHDLGLAGGGKNICLIQVGMDSGAALTDLENSFDATASTGRITLWVEDDLRLLCNVAGEGGTVILVK
ncbi:MAG: hypothetical protein FWG50_11585 [Kiritimatiellaeota bacterium]|nr:hypothetical protein [Kiritimatiellota bacterium]